MKTIDAADAFAGLMNLAKLYPELWPHKGALLSTAAFLASVEAQTALLMLADGELDGLEHLPATTIAACAAWFSDLTFGMLADGFMMPPVHRTWEVVSGTSEIEQARAVVATELRRLMAT